MSDERDASLDGDAIEPEDLPGDSLRSNLQRLMEKRREIDVRRGAEQRQSLEGLRFSALMKQMQALQAIQGLQDLAPGKPGEKRRIAFSDHPEERAQQRQWLEFKADWLQAVLADTIDEIEDLDDFEQASGDGSPGQQVDNE